MRTHFYIEDKNDDWRELSDRIDFSSVGNIEFKISGQHGQMVLVPPKSITVNNKDGFWLTEPEDTGSVWSGAWEGRRVRFTLERNGEDEATLGTFRVAVEDGLVVSRDGTAKLKLESMAESLRRGDASDVSYGKGWHQQIPWPVAIDMLRKPEDTSSLTFPDGTIPYQGFQYGASTLGRPGDYTDDGFEDIRKVAVDVTFNMATDKFCFATTNKLYEWDPDTGLYEELTLSFTIPSGSDIIRVWYRYATTGSYYAVLTAPRNVAYANQGTDGSGYYQPRDGYQRYVEGCYLWRHNSASCLMNMSTYKLKLAPVIFRDLEYQNTSTSTQINVVNSAGSAAHPHQEAPSVPFGQYIYSLLSKDTAAGAPAENMFQLMYHQMDAAIDGSAASPPIYIYHNRNDSNEAGEEFYEPEKRAGKAWWVGVHLRTGYWASGEHFIGERYSMGNGPMVDFSYPTSSDFASSVCVLTACYWDTANDRWIIYAFQTNVGSAPYSNSVVALDSHVCPTFIATDAGAWASDTKKFVVFIGWINCGSTNTDDQIDMGGGTMQAVAPCGVAIYQSLSITSTSISFNTGSGSNYRALTFTQSNDTAALGSNYYGASNEARWIPISCAIGQYTDGYGVLHYNLFLGMLDREDVSPSEGPATPFRIFRAHFKITAGVLSLHDLNGAATQWISGLPPMGWTKTHVGKGHDSIYTTTHVYFYSPSERAVYAIDHESNGKAELVAILDADDSFLSHGVLAAGHQNMDNVDLHQVCGVTSPVFPWTGSERWPLGQYYGFYVGERHSGRVPLLDTSEMTKLDAINRLAALADSRFYFDRDGDAQLELRPTTDDSVDLELDPRHYAAASRSFLPIVNHAQRSVYNVVPGPVAIKVRLTPGSEWNVDPAFSGLSVYPVELEIRCVAGGNVSEVETYWAFRETVSRVQSSLAVNASAGVSLIYLTTSEGIEVGDFVTLSVDDQDLRITVMYPGSGTVAISSPLSNSYSADDPVVINKHVQGRWSDALDYSDSAYHGIAAVRASASAGDKVIEVTTLAPFAVGTRFRIYDEGGPSSSYDEREYTITKLLPTRETGENDPEIEFEDDDGDGLANAVVTGDAITARLRLTPANRSAVIGEDGVVFSAYGVAGDQIDEEEMPALEGDRILLSYPGLELNKNQHSKVSARDMDSIEAHGKKAARLQANKFMDYPLATVDVYRRIERDAQKRIKLQLTDVSHRDAQLLEPDTIIGVTDDKLFPEKSTDDYRSIFAITQHRTRGQKLGLVDITAEEVVDPFDRDRAADDWKPADDDDVQVLLQSLPTDEDKEGEPDDGAAVSEWSSANGSGVDFAQATGSKQPTFYTGQINGYGAIKGDGTDDHLTAGTGEVHSNTTGLSVHALVHYSGYKPNKVIVSKYDTADAGDRGWVLKADSWYVGEDKTTFDANAYVGYAITAGWHLVSGIWVPGEQPKVYVDGSLYATATTAVDDIDDTTCELMLLAYRHGADQNYDYYLPWLAICNVGHGGTKISQYYSYIQNTFGM